MIKQVYAKLLLTTTIAIFLCLTACSGDFEYTGDNPELYSVAINSILGIHGYALSSWGPQRPTVRILEEDNYGRVMFLYSEDSYISPVSIVVMQKADEVYAYFYPHYNFFSDWFFFLEEDPDIESVAALKETNSWNQEMSDASEFVRVRIVRYPEPGPIADETLIEAFRSVFPGSPSRPNQITANNPFLRMDSYGRSVYLIFGPQWEYIDDEYVRTFVYVAILFQPDHSLDIDNGTLLITDLFNYQTDLRLFMEANGWDTPFYP